MAFLLFIFIILSSGCETTKGVAQGIGQGIGSTVGGAAKDTQNLWQVILKADQWMKDNLW